MSRPYADSETTIAEARAALDTILIDWAASYSAALEDQPGVTPGCVTDCYRRFPNDVEARNQCIQTNCPGPMIQEPENTQFLYTLDNIADQAMSNLYVAIDGAVQAAMAPSCVSDCYKAFPTDQAQRDQCIQQNCQGTQQPPPAPKPVDAA